MSLPKRKRQGLWACNLAAFVFHLVSATILIGLTASDAAKGNTPTVPTFLRYLNDTPSQGNYVQQPLGVPIYVRALAITFALISSLFHLLIVADNRFVRSLNAGWTIYLNNIQNKCNPIRWTEYGISATIMLVLIGSLVGITDFAQICNAVGCNVAMIGYGHMAERLWLAERKWGFVDENKGYFSDKDFKIEKIKNSNEKNRMQGFRGLKPWHKGWVQAFTLGSVAGVAPWISIIVYFFGALARSRKDVPWFVWTIIWGEFFQFMGFAGVMLFQHTKPSSKSGFGLFKYLNEGDPELDGKFKCGKIPVRNRYEAGEYLYVLLSFMSKAWLTWFVYPAPV